MDPDHLHSIAVRMRREMPLTERTIHLQTFKWTFTGQQAVAFLLSSGVSSGQAAAEETCQQLLQHGLFKSIYHKDQFTPDNEVFRFSSSLLSDHKHKGLARLPITSSGIYKEIAKFGKAAAQPFKNVQVSLNDTFANLSAAPRLAISSSGRHQSLPGRPGGASSRRSTGNKGEAAAHSDSEEASLGTLVAVMRSLQDSLKESTSLVRLDLQQHTALQEHMVGLMMKQQAQQSILQLLVALNAAGMALLLAATSGWPLSLVSGGLLVAVAVLLALSRWPGAARAQPALGLLTQDKLPSSQSMLLGRQSRTAGSSIDQEPLAAGGANSGRPTASSEEGEECEVFSDAEGPDWEDSTPCLDDFDDWPDAPLMLLPDPSVPKQVFGLEQPGPCHALPLNTGPIPFESELFRGEIAVFVRHLGSTPGQLFKGKKRLTWIALQGTFKRPVSMDSLVFGQEFARKLCNLPAPWFIDNMLLPLARKISPALRVGSLDQPYFYSPLITASQVVNVSLPGAAPPLMEAREDTSLIADRINSRSGDLSTVAARRKHFQSQPHRASSSFTPGYVWTFHLWQEYLDYAAYELNLSYSTYDLTQHLDGQPLQVMVKDVASGAFLVNLQAWHSNLVRSSHKSLSRQPAHRPRPPLGRAETAHAATAAAAAAAAAGEGAGGGGETPPQMFLEPQQRSGFSRLSDAGSELSRPDADEHHWQQQHHHHLQQQHHQQVDSNRSSPRHMERPAFGGTGSSSGIAQSTSLPSAQQQQQQQALQLRRRLDGLNADDEGGGGGVWSPSLPGSQPPSEPQTARHRDFVHQLSAASLLAGAVPVPDSSHSLGAVGSAAAGGGGGSNSNSSQMRQRQQAVAAPAATAAEGAAEAAVDPRSAVSVSATSSFSKAHAAEDSEQLKSMRSL